MIFNNKPFKIKAIKINPEEPGLLQVVWKIIQMVYATKMVIQNLIKMNSF
jgi:hypothetical protein